jgi:hypothetical protein
MDYKSFNKPMSYVAASGDPLTGVGTIKFRTEFAEVIVKNALYAPSAHTSILSVYRLRQSGYRTEDGPDFTYRICDHQSRLIGIAVPKNGVYVLPLETRRVYSVTTPNLLRLWHLHLGHDNYRSVSEITKIPFKPDSIPKLCHPCLAGKQIRNRSTKPRVRAENAF